MAVSKKNGRPSKYSEKLVNRILEAIATTTHSLKYLCDKNKDFPSHQTVRRWIAEDREGFRDKYARAKQEQADLLADEIIEIADETKVKTVTHERVNAARLRVDARKWIAAKLKPKTYGDKVDVTTDGESLNKGYYDFLKQRKTKGDG